MPKMMYFLAVQVMNYLNWMHALLIFMLRPHSLVLQLVALFER